MYIIIIIIIKEVENEFVVVVVCNSNLNVCQTVNIWDCLIDKLSTIRYVQASLSYNELCLYRVWLLWVYIFSRTL